MQDDESLKVNDSAYIVYLYLDVKIMGILYMNIFFFFKTKESAGQSAVVRIFEMCTIW